MGIIKAIKSLKQLTGKQQTQSDILNFDRLPVMSADDLIRFTRQQGRLRNIKRIVGIDEKRYKILYQDVIDRFAELVQLMPASQAHHHAVPGGLFIHTLEVIEYAVMLRQQYKLPLFAPQEVQQAERHLWSYAIFVAAMLHDAGKRLTLCRFILDDGTTALAPFGTDLPEGRYYSIRFLPTKYHVLHEKIGLSFVGLLLPPVALNYLMPHLHIMGEVMAYIHGDENMDGTVGNIIREADRRSTGQSLAHTPSRKFRGADLENIGERLMTQLRQLLASNHFVINRSNGNVYTTKEGYTYIVSKTLADTLRTTLAEAEQTDIPGDNNRIFDIFGEYGFAENNNKGQVIHYICRVWHDKAQTFSVLKFETSKLFRVLPAEFDGIVVEVSGKPGKSGPHGENAESASFPEEPVKAFVPAPAWDNTTGTDYAEQLNTDATDDDAWENSPFTDTAYRSVAPQNTPPEKNDETVAATDNSKKSTELLQTTEPNTAKPEDTLKTASVSTTPEKRRVKTESADPDIGEKFLAWCREKILDKSIVVNESNGRIQKVPYKGRDVIAVVSPRTFMDFATESLGLAHNKQSVERVQKAIHAKKLNIPGSKGQLHSYKIVKSENNPLGGNNMLYHYLFEIDIFCADNEDIKEIMMKTRNNDNLAIC